MNAPSQYDLRCSLSHGDIYGQILIWLLISVLSLASGMALLAAGRPTAGITT